MRIENLDIWARPTTLAHVIHVGELFVLFLLDAAFHRPGKLQIVVSSSLLSANAALMGDQASRKNLKRSFLEDEDSDKQPP